MPQFVPRKLIRNFRIGSLHEKEGEGYKLILMEGRFRSFVSSLRSFGGESTTVLPAKRGRVGSGVPIEEEKEDEFLFIDAAQAPPEAKVESRVDKEVGGDASIQEQPSAPQIQDHNLVESDTQQENASPCETHQTASDSTSLNCTATKVQKSTQIQRRSNNLRW